MALNEHVPNASLLVIRPRRRRRHSIHSVWTSSYTIRDLSSVRVWFHHRRTLLIDIPPRRSRSRPPRIARDLDAARRQQGMMMMMMMARPDRVKNRDSTQRRLHGMVVIYGKGKVQSNMAPKARESTYIYIYYMKRVLLWIDAAAAAPPGAKQYIMYSYTERTDCRLSSSRRNMDGRWWWRTTYTTQNAWIKTDWIRLLLLSDGWLVDPGTFVCVLYVHT